MNEVDTRSRKILLLAFIFFVCGLIFFFGRIGSNEPAAPISAQPIKGNDASVGDMLKKMPPPSSYKMFVYDGTPITVTGECLDAYQTILIYNEKSDYREDTLSAKYNLATACVAQEDFSVIIDLTNAQLVMGETYYIIRAHQGSTGSWYNPY